MQKRIHTAFVYFMTGLFLFIAAGCSRTPATNPPPTDGGPGTPTVVITNPTDGELFLFVGGNVVNQTLTGDVSDDANVLPQNIKWTVTDPNGAVTTNQGAIGGGGLAVTTSLQAVFDILGNYTIELSYSDGALTGSDIVTITLVDNLPPEVEIRDPQDNDNDGVADVSFVETTQWDLIGRARELDGDTIDSATIEWTVTDPDGGVSQNAGTVVCNGANTSCTSTFTYTFVIVGTYTLTFSYTDANATLYEHTLTLDIRANTPPTCQIITPAADSAVGSGAGITLEALVADADEPAGNLTVEWFFGAVGATADASGNPVNATAPAGAACDVQSLICVVTDSFGATGQDSINFKTNTAPTLTVNAVTDSLATDVWHDAGNPGAFFDTANSTGPIVFDFTAGDTEDDASALTLTVDLYDSQTGIVVATDSTVSAAGLTPSTLNWAVDTATDIGHHTLAARVTDSCGSTAWAAGEVIVGPQADLVIPMTELANVRIEGIFEVGDVFYISHRDVGGNDAFSVFSGVDAAAGALGTQTDFTALLADLNNTRANSVVAIGSNVYIGTDDGLIVCPKNADGSPAVADPTQPTECTAAAIYTDGNGNTIADPQTLELLALPGGALAAATDSGVVLMSAPATAPGRGVACRDNGVRVWDIAYDMNSDAIYGGTDGEFAFRWDAPFDACSLTAVDDTNSPLNAGNDSVVRAVEADIDGIWFATEEPTLAYLDTANDLWTFYRDPMGGLIAGEPLVDIAVDIRSMGTPAADRGILWAAVDNQSGNPAGASVIRRDEAIPVWTAYAVDPDGLPEMRVNSITVDSNGIKWVGTRNQGVAAYLWP